MLFHILLLKNQKARLNRKTKPGLLVSNSLAIDFISIIYTKVLVNASVRLIINYMEEKIKIESDSNPFPKMDIIPGIGLVKRFGNFICFAYLFNKEEDQPNTGASPMLDDALYDTEHAVGHMVVVGEVSAEEGSDWIERIDWIEQATLFPRHINGKS